MSEIDENKTEPLIFINESLPQLAAGNYSVKASFVVNDNNDFTDVSKDFWVDAPRFVLPQSDIYTIYPPKGATGHFETTLPHIVLSRRTLPWERTIDGRSIDTTGFKDTKGHAPWMGLLLLSEDEIAGSSTGQKVTIEKRSVKDIFADQADTLVPGIGKYDKNNKEKQSHLSLSPWDDESSVCEIIEMPFDLFKKVIPLKEDLSFLAHVRQVKVDEHKERADISDDGYFSTLICNRLPVRDDSKPLRNTVFLVSFEGLHDYFNDTAGTTKKKVRLVVLSSWSFTVSKGKNFKELCEGLRVSPYKMDYPATVNTSLKTAYDYGYTMLPHSTRDGANTYSWYRGPFNPNFLPANSVAKTFSSADEALRFDHNMGIFDVSYAAAWQLGRLLALKDKVFSNAMYKWKVSGKKNVLKNAALQQVNSMFPKGYAPSQEAKNGTLEDLVKDFLTQSYDPGSKNRITTTVSTDPGKLRNQLGKLAADAENGPDIPSEISDWLGKLFLLHGVPLNYLIPNDNYLVSHAAEGEIEKEALGFFYIDYDWVEALIAGALSIVPSDDYVVLFNKLQSGAFLPKNIEINRIATESLPAGEGKSIAMPDNIPGHITGFLLRSELVSGWKGIKVYPKDAKGEWMDAPLRIERIAEDMTLCIFSGKVQEVWIIQPPEGIHFGVEQGTKGKPYTKKMRNAKGDTLRGGKVDVSFREPGSGVLQLAKLAAGMQANNEAIGKQKDDTYSSADLAFQMLEVPVMYALKIEKDK